MTIYVDQIQTYPIEKVAPLARRYGNRWCHLVSDGADAELHQFARSIGLAQSAFQPHRFWSHYDLTPGLRAKAIRNGAIEVQSLAQLAQKIGKLEAKDE